MDYLRILCNIKEITYKYNKFTPVSISIATGLSSPVSVYRKKENAADLQLLY